MTNWDERYRRGEHGDDTPLPLVAEYAAKLSPGRALELDCGLGRHALHLAERGWQVTAVDSSQVALEILRERARLRGVNVDTRFADLECGEFVIETETYLDIIRIVGSHELIVQWEIPLIGPTQAVRNRYLSCTRDFFFAELGKALRPDL
jgi:SAM-dependent methyltransferase